MTSDQLSSAAALRSWNDQLAGMDGDDDVSAIINNISPYGRTAPVARSTRRQRANHSFMTTTTPVEIGSLLQASVKSDPNSQPSDAELAGGSSHAPGTLLELKRVDEVFDRTRNTWISRDAEIQGEKPAEKDAYEAYAFTLNRHFDQMMMSSTLTVDIRSLLLRQVGAEVIGAVSGISWTAKPLKVDPKVLITFLPALELHVEELKSRTNSFETLGHLKFLVETMHSEYEATLTEYSSLIEHGEINFELIYVLLVPGSIVYFPCPVTRAPRAAKLSNVEMKVNGTARWWQVDVEYVEFDSLGTAKEAQFGLAKQSLIISQFKGARRITNLPVYPIHYFTGAEELKAQLIERGKKWVGLQGMHHMYHSGFAFHNKQGNHVKINCNSRVMVDRATFSQTVPNYLLPPVAKTLDGEDINRHAPIRNSGVAINFQATQDSPPQKWTDELLMLCSTIVYGFSLTDKLWLEFNVENISSFEWNDEPFENLVLAGNEKKLVQSLVETHDAGDSGFDDFVHGKGKGLVINLFGNPGVGKTLTAEATSEHVRKPLYVVGAGDLGTKAALLDANLTRIFSMSSAWDAVVLIDEADVFLEERSLHDLERNAMVAVFLRQLEYFRGILFLTTNRVRTFDEAFQSRIHVSLRYQDLSDEARLHIWIAFLKKARASEMNNAALQPSSIELGLTEVELQNLSKRKVNGRQIKNVVRTASALAQSGKEPIKYEHLAHVLQLMEAFELSTVDA